MARYDETRWLAKRGTACAKSAGKLLQRHKYITFLLAMFFASASGAWAQNGAPPAGPPLTSGYVPIGWQFSVGYQFNQPDLKGAYPPFITNGFNGSAVWYFGHFAGVEGDVGVGFGHYAPHDSLVSVTPSGGLHLAYHNRSRFEPWAHGLIGGSYYHFALPQPPVLKSFALSWTFGGGVDVRVRRGVTIRFEGDYVGTHFGGVFQRQPQAVSGLVWNF